MTKDEKWMQIAINEAKLAMKENEIPVGSVLVQNEKIIAKAHNQPIGNNDPTAHAEIQLLRRAGKEQENYRLGGSTLYVTLEPCQMCAGAMYWAQLSRLVYGASDPHRGFKVLGTKIHPKTKVTSGVMSKESKLLIDAFFIKKRKEKQD